MLGIFSFFFRHNAMISGWTLNDQPKLGSCGFHNRATLSFAPLTFLSKELPMKDSLLHFQKGRGNQLRATLTRKKTVEHFVYMRKHFLIWIKLLWETGYFYHVAHKLCCWGWLQRSFKCTQRLSHPQGFHTANLQKGMIRCFSSGDYQHVFKPTFVGKNCFRYLHLNTYWEH